MYFVQSFFFTLLKNSHWGRCCHIVMNLYRNDRNFQPTTIFRSAGNIEYSDDRSSSAYTSIRLWFVLPERTKCDSGFTIRNRKHGYGFCTNIGRQVERHRFVRKVFRTRPSRRLRRRRRRRIEWQVNSCVWVFDSIRSPSPRVRQRTHKFRSYVIRTHAHTAFPHSSSSCPVRVCLRTASTVHIIYTTSGAGCAVNEAEQ